uniref:Kinesin family member 20B n=1 Tax=Pavo cristatus TaxID=9049 RepID=A0A8C9LDU2_PAVCR
SLEPRGHIQVCLRIKPLTALERGCVSLEDSTSVILRPPKSSLSRLREKTVGQTIQKFTFSRVFGPEATQEEFFEGTMKQPVQDFLEGCNRLVFTYGVTNAGKTYTFQGTEDDVGILPRTMDMLFKTIGGRLYSKMDLKPIRWRDYIKLTKDEVREETAVKNSLLRLTKEIPSDILTVSLKRSEPSSGNFSKFSVWVSFFEIYNECFYDLLAPMSNDKKKRTLHLAQDIQGYSYVKGLQWVQVSDSKEAFRLFKLGQKHQSFASTRLNTCSSRSHSVFTIKVLKIEDLEMPRVTRVNELSLCDLAGSERYTKTRNEGDRLKESGNINTSLLTLSKCIILVQSHIPFRESKLTHFLQGFFSGKGKIHMLVNISQCASACDETFNVLRFSAIAQKVITDASVPPHDESFGQKSARGPSIPCCSQMTIPRRSTGFLWDRTLGEVMEDDDVEMEEEENKSGEETVPEHEETKVLLGREEYSVSARAALRISVSLRLISNILLFLHLSNKLIAEKEDKLLLEVKIRDEMAQEFTRYFAEQETEFKECFSRERERLEENFEKRLEIFKEFVSGYAGNPDEEKLNDVPLPDTCVDLEGILDSLQNDVVDIKKQAEAAHSYIASFADPQEAIGWLEKQLAKSNLELMKTKEELTEKNTKLLKTEEELTQKNKGELCGVQATIKTKLAEENSNKVTESSQFKEREESELEVGRKRCFEDKPTVEEPPPKKGTVSSIAEQGVFQRNKLIPIAEWKQKVVKRMPCGMRRKERTEALEHHLGVLEEQCRREKNKKEGFSKQVTSLRIKLSFSEETVADLCEQIQQCQAEYREIASELDEQRSINMGLEEKNVGLNNVIEAAKQNIIDKVSHVKAVQTKFDELYKRHLESYAIDTDLVDVKDSSGSEKDEPETSQLSSACVQSQTSSISDLAQDRSFYYSLERIWEVCKRIIDVSSQKCQQIEALLQDVESLKKGLKDAENYNDQLEMKQSEMTNPGSQEEDLMNQLQEQMEKKTRAFESKAAEDHRVIAQLEEEVANCEVKIRQLECLLEAFRTKGDSVTELKELLKEKESTIVNLEKVTAALQEKSANADRKVEELSNKEANLMEEVKQLKNSLEQMKHCHWEKEKCEKEKKETVEVLEKVLAESSVLVLNLKRDLQRKEEESADLKDKLSDANRQILQVQSEVCSQLRYFSYKIMLDLCAKEKIIEVMRMTLEEQEETQLEQGQALEAHLEEKERLASGNLSMEREQGCKSALDESEAKYQSDRKQWLEEKEGLLNQIKEAENLRNREMKKFAEDRQRHGKQQAEIERLVAQLEEKDRNLQKWREERDQLVEALEVQLKTLASNAIQKEKEIAELKQSALRDSSKVSSLFFLSDLLPLNSAKRYTCSLYFGCISVPKHCGIDIMCSYPKKRQILFLVFRNRISLRKELAEKDDFIKELKQCLNHDSPQSLPEVPLLESRQDRMDRSVNEKKSREEYFLRKQVRTSSKRLTRKKDAPLQKIGDFLQSSPSILHSKAKKLMAAVSSLKSPEPESLGEEEIKPKRSKRKLYSTDISGPLDIPASSVSDYTLLFCPV